MGVHERERKFGSEFGKGFMEGRLGGVFDLEGNFLLEVDGLRLR